MDKKKRYAELLAEINMLAEEMKPQSFGQPELVVEYMLGVYAGENQREETMTIMYLDAKHQLIEMETMRGTIDYVVMYPRNIVKKLLDVYAKAVLMVHNHPSGYVMPSSMDIQLTTKVKEALNFFDAKLLDHIIIGQGSKYFSFVKECIL